jgi:hypothetical protein
MIKPTRSYQKVFYSLRPAKQVERRMIIDTFQRLMVNGFSILDYQYTGLGSIYFVDFILFHRYLGIKKLLCAEYVTGIENRMEFNRPYDLVEIEMKSIGSVIPILDRDIKHILWLDYDARLNKDIMSDITLASYSLSTGSVLMITIDVKPPEGRNNPRGFMEYFSEEAGMYFEHHWEEKNFSQSELDSVNYQLVMNAIKDGLSSRSGCNFIQLFNFSYRDSSPMITIGGVIGTEVEKKLVNNCDFSDMDFIRLNDEKIPYDIYVPRLTRKERIYMDKHMPCNDDWLPRKFELNHYEVLRYREIYRYYPLYGELLI